MSESVNEPMRTTSTTAGARSEDRFPELAAAVRLRAASFAGRPIFRTRAKDLFKVYLEAFAPAEKQPHNCHCCRTFLERFGSLVVVNDEDQLEPLFWGDGSDVPPVYADSVRELRRAVASSEIGDVFLCSDPSWGVGRTGEWNHFAVPSPARYQHTLKTAGQAMAEKREEYGMLQRGLAEFPRELVAKAAALIEADTLYRSEKVAGPATWLLAVHNDREDAGPGRARDNVTWLAIATAPAGFAHVRSTMVGTLLEDLAAGMDFDQVSRRFADKMHPLQYLRPTAPPSDGQIAQAEKVVEVLKAAGALDRRFAKLADMKTAWTPRAPTSPAKGEGVFGHLRKGAIASAPLEVDKAVAITWTRFAREVLPNADRVECLVPSHGPFVAFVTAANPEAPPILKWDFEDARNPVSWYLYHGGSRAQDWNLPGGEYVEVKAFVLSPAHWTPERAPKNEAQSVAAILAGAKDLRHKKSGGFFPEILKADFHAVRRTMEAYANAAAIAGLDEADANGIVLQASAGPWNTIFRVHGKGLSVLYRPDRWD